MRKLLIIIGLVILVGVYGLRESWFTTEDIKRNVNELTSYLIELVSDLKEIITENKEPSLPTTNTVEDITEGNIEETIEDTEKDIADETIDDEIEEIILPSFQYIEDVHLNDTVISFNIGSGISLLDFDVMSLNLVNSQNEIIESKIVSIESLEDISFDNISYENMYSIQLKIDGDETQNISEYHILKRSYTSDITPLVLDRVIDINMPITDVSQYRDYLFKILSSGVDEFTISCDSNVDCSTFVEEEYSNMIWEISNYIHSYSQFRNVDFSYNTTEITLSFTKIYTSENISNLDLIIQGILNEIIESDFNDNEKIKAIHDYVIDTTKYNSLCYEVDEDCSGAYDALGVFLRETAVCEGYSHAIDIMLRKLDINIHFLTSAVHKWNVVYHNESWLHLDATWDDPINPDAMDENYLRHDYFLIDTATINELDSSESHNYDADDFAHIN